MTKKKSDAPAEVETITLTMSRPVAEAVQTACEWYLRLHMGQFWDLAEDLCFAKFYYAARNGTAVQQMRSPGPDLRRNEGAVPGRTGMACHSPRPGMA